ncbi:unnamed protein product [Strongylus vulgaris]|uniref:Uncharacterized protein n=1 Tax=Strongylus vulgaris TaxID=40348 RepID=A0A3P7JDQ7_STRVU|nr:unnamed protein product [Strongylus vulgaris]
MVHRLIVVRGDSGFRTAKYSRGLSSSRISQAEKEFDVSGFPDAQLRVGHARSTTVWLIQSLGGTCLHDLYKKEKPCALDHISGVGCHQDQCQVAQDAMDFGPKGHVNDSPWRLSHAMHLQRDSLH